MISQEYVNRVVLTYQGQTQKLPLQMMKNWAYFHFRLYCFTCPSLKSDNPTPIIFFRNHKEMG